MQKNDWIFYFLFVLYVKAYLPLFNAFSSISAYGEISASTSSGTWSLSSSAPPFNITAALVEYRPSYSGGDTTDYPRTVYEEVSVASNNSNNKTATTDIAAEALDATAIPAGSHLMIMVKGDSDTAGDTAVVSMAIGLSW